MRKLIAGLVGLVVLALLADLGAGALTEYRLSRAYRAHAGLDADPSVAISGFPFLRYALTGTYPTVEIRAEGVEAAPLAMQPGAPNRVGTEATLRTVELTPAQLFSGSVDSLLAQKVDGRIAYGQTALGRAAGIPDLQVDPLPPRVVDAFGTATPQELSRYRRVLLSASFPEIGIEDPVQVEAETSLRGGRLRIDPVMFHRGADGTTPVEVPEESQQKVLRLLTMDLPVDTMPFGLAPTYVTPQNGRLLVEGTARELDVLLGAG